MGRDIWRYRRGLGASFKILSCHDRFTQTRAFGTAQVEERVHVEQERVHVEQVKFDNSKWRAFNSSYLGVQRSMITASTWAVLTILRDSGSDVYLVGGCVRDLLLKKIPKDFDIVTNADPVQIIKRFRRCHLVGKRFPVCLVQTRGSIVEVASFGTLEKFGKRELRSFPQRPPYCSHADYVRWKDCMRRDFTINGLMYDPFANRIYDYTGGMEDIKMAKVRTVMSAHTSFEEDCARILRAFRVAGRLGFEFTSDTACAIEDLSRSILKLHKARLMMEMHYMLAYGSAEATLCLLKEYGVLETLLPVQAAYLSSQGFKRHEKGCYSQSNMLLTLLSNLDKLLASDRPCDSSLWLGLLAFHSTLVNMPQDALVVTTFSFYLYYGGYLQKAMDSARKIFQVAKKFSPEIVEADESKTDVLLANEVLNLASAARSSLVSMVDNKVPSTATSENPQLHGSNVDFISKTTHAKVKKIFCVLEDNDEALARDRGLLQGVQGERRRVCSAGGLGGAGSSEGRRGEV
ncbi:hypothetical protein SUGI_0267220 [Cryptomeria japonica]|nr:hypothetical protein SUGI_0267220 [Cryptomeria japonica]